MLEYFKKSLKFKFHVLPKFVNKKIIQEFEKSETNIVRSISSFYSICLFSKEKYKEIYLLGFFLLKEGRKFLTTDFLLNGQLDTVPNYSTKLMPN